MSEKPNRPFMIAIIRHLLAAHVDGRLTANATTPQGGDCRDLSRACEMKDELGEGEDNCVKFRKSCSPSTPHLNCEWLRIGCMYREELGIEGQNNCGRYRENCSHDRDGTELIELAALSEIRRDLGIRTSGAKIQNLPSWAPRPCSARQMVRRYSGLPAGRCLPATR